MNRRTFLKAAGTGVGTLALDGQAILQAGSHRQVPGSPTSPIVADVVVVGAGVFGGWTALHLREMGLSVLLIDQYGPGNAKSSSGGDLRQIRATYGDRELYSRWAMQAWERWKIREAEWDLKLLFPTGGFTLAREWNKNLTDTKNVFDRLKIPYEVIPPDELKRRYPQMISDSNESFAFYTPTTGLLKSREGCVAVAHAFETKGGRFVLGKAALGRKSGGRLQDLTLSSGPTIAAQTFVYACGPWLPRIFPDVMKDKLSVQRRAYFMIGTPAGDDRFSYPNIPNGGGGHPSIEGAGFMVSAGSGTVEVDPDTHDRVPTESDARQIREMLARRFPALKDQPILGAHICQSDDSIDGNFIVDRHPELDNVWIVGGGSYHGYKFGPVLGDYVAGRIVGRDRNTEVDATFKLKKETFAEARSSSRVPEL
jgi:glycine/D-amino acid oxidase-like deaminating enzyme